MNAIASLMDFEDILSIMGIFAEKILQNLVYGNSQTEDNNRLVETTLDVFDIFVYTNSSCRMFCKLQIIKQLIQNHLVINPY